MGLVVYCHLSGTATDNGTAVKVIFSSDVEGKSLIAVETAVVPEWGTGKGAYTLLRAYEFALDRIHKAQAEFIRNDITDVVLVYHNKNLYKWVIEEKGSKNYLEILKNKVHSKYCYGGEKEIQLHLSLIRPEVKSVALDFPNEEQSELQKKLKFKQIQVPKNK